MSKGRELTGVTEQVPRLLESKGTSEIRSRTDYVGVTGESSG